MSRSAQALRDLRRQLRSARRGIPTRERRAAERAIVRHLRRLLVFRRGVRVAVYLAMAGEVDVARALPAARRAGAQLYAPRITSERRRRMAFVPLPPGPANARNVYGIAEPPPGRPCPPRDLDTVIVPLVGFDRRGHRLGMGAGYYDRALRRRLDPRRAWRRPRLIGVAFACQQVAAIAPAPWDVPLDLVVTEAGVLDCRGPSSR